MATLTMRFEMVPNSNKSRYIRRDNETSESELPSFILRKVCLCTDIYRIEVYNPYHPDRTGGQFDNPAYVTREHYVISRIISDSCHDNALCSSETYPVTNLHLTFSPCWRFSLIDLVIPLKVKKQMQKVIDHQLCCFSLLVKKGILAEQHNIEQKLNLQQIKLTRYNYVMVLVCVCQMFEHKT